MYPGWKGGLLFVYSNLIYINLAVGQHKNTKLGSLNSEYRNSLIGSRLLYFDTLPSTNLFALDYISKNSPKEGLIVYTYNQTAGLGQYGRKWITAPGKNLTMSVILEPDFLSPSQQFAISMFASISVKQFLESALGTEVSVKWPNDILVGTQKIAGILIQNVISSKMIRYSVIGIGININQEKFPKFHRSATSCKLITGKSFSLDAIRMLIIDELQKNYALLKVQPSFESLRERYLNCLYGRDQSLNFKLKSNGSNFQGTIRSIDEFGRLLVEVQGKEKLFNLREITY